jgi:hypothetical protein
MRTCSIAYWILTVFFFPLFFSFSLFQAVYLLYMNNRKIKLDYKFHETDLKYNFINITILYIFAFLAGSVGTLLGVGGI